ncbi:hypothetical protein Hypma_009862 [Hypsizygus marmoreus]|uniref:RING-type domain-containing protein n=1 Tax=Hypsizygus marmoreus TaxID=39966 RepID=A0A369JNL1_HYPMA|nr:hypothetical protein Hypma_009862 [Hypsizygus marmoreus]
MLRTLTRGDHPIVLSDHDEQSTHGDHDGDPIITPDDESRNATLAINGPRMGDKQMQVATRNASLTMNGLGISDMQIQLLLSAERDAPFTRDADARAQSLNLQSKISQACNSASRCSTCRMTMRRPFTTICGHSACGSCFRTYFRKCLGAKLRRIPYLREHMKDVYNCREVPTSRAHLSYLVGVLKNYHVHRPQSVLTYPCPLCTHAVAFPPVEAIGMRNFISEVQGALNVTLAESELADEAGVTTIGYFEGLFLEDI